MIVSLLADARLPFLLDVVGLLAWLLSVLAVGVHYNLSGSRRRQVRGWVIRRLRAIRVIPVHDLVPATATLAKRLLTRLYETVLGSLVATSIALTFAYYIGFLVTAMLVYRPQSPEVVEAAHRLEQTVAPELWAQIPELRAALDVRCPSVHPDRTRCTWLRSDEQSVDLRREYDRYTVNVRREIQGHARGPSIGLLLVIRGTALHREIGPVLRLDGLLVTTFTLMLVNVATDLGSLFVTLALLAALSRSRGWLRQATLPLLDIGLAASLMGAVLLSYGLIFTGSSGALFDLGVRLPALIVGVLIGLYGAGSLGACQHL